MTDSPVASDQGPRSGSGTAILIGIVVLLTLGAGFWFYRSFVPDRSTAEVSIAEYLNLKSQGSIRAARLKGPDLDAEMAGGGFIRDGQAYKRIHCSVPPAYLEGQKGFEDLHSGLSPSQFIYTRE